MSVCSVVRWTGLVSALLVCCVRGRVCVCMRVSECVCVYMRVCECMSVCSVVRWTGLGLSAARVLCSWESVCVYESV